MVGGLKGQSIESGSHHPGILLGRAPRGSAARLPPQACRGHRAVERRARLHRARRWRRCRSYRSTWLRPRLARAASRRRPHHPCRRSVRGPRLPPALQPLSRPAKWADIYLNMPIHDDTRGSGSQSRHFKIVPLLVVFWGVAAMMGKSIQTPCAWLNEHKGGGIRWRGRTLPKDPRPRTFL